MDEMVKIKVADIRFGESGHTLTMSPTEGPQIKFLLDDVAIALLALTAGFVTKELTLGRMSKERGEPKPLIFEAVKSD